MPDRNPVTLPQAKASRIQVRRSATLQPKASPALGTATSTTATSSNNPSLSKTSAVPIPSRTAASPRKGSDRKPPSRSLRNFTLSFLGSRFPLTDVNFSSKTVTGNTPRTNQSAESSNDQDLNSLNNNINLNAVVNRNENKNICHISSEFTLSPPVVLSRSLSCPGSSESVFESKGSKMASPGRTQEMTDPNNNTRESRRHTTNMNDACDSDRELDPAVNIRESINDQQRIVDVANINLNTFQSVSSSQMVGLNLNENTNINSTTMHSSVLNDNDMNVQGNRRRPLLRADSGIDTSLSSDRDDEGGEQHDCSCGKDSNSFSYRQQKRQARFSRGGKQQKGTGIQRRRPSTPPPSPKPRKPSLSRCFSWTSLDSAVGGSITSINLRRDGSGGDGACGSGSNHKNVSNNPSSSRSSLSLSSPYSSLSSLSSSLSSLSRSSLSWREASLDSLHTWSTPDCSRIISSSQEDSSPLASLGDENSFSKSWADASVVGATGVSSTCPTSLTEVVSACKESMVSERSAGKPMLGSHDVTVPSVLKPEQESSLERLAQEETIITANIAPISRCEEASPRISTLETTLITEVTRLPRPSSRLSRPAGAVSPRRHRHRHRRQSLKDLNNNTSIHDGSRPHSFLPASLGRLGDCLNENGVLAFLLMLTYTLVLMVVFAALSNIAKGVMTIVGEEDLKEMRKSLTQSRRSRRVPAPSG